MIEHDRKLCFEAAQIRNFDYAKMDELRNLCLSDEGKRFIDRLISREYHHEEAMAGNL